MANSLYDSVMDSLLAYLQANIPANTFLSYRRGIEQYETLAIKQDNRPLIRQPALYLYDGIGFGGGTIQYEQRGRARPVVRVIDRTIVIYAKAPSAGGLPGGFASGPAVETKGGGPIFHGLIEAVETALAKTDSQGALTLGGLVSHCWLEGKGDLTPPDLDPVNGQGMATMPVRIMIP